MTIDASRTLYACRAQINLQGGFRILPPALDECGAVRALSAMPSPAKVAELEHELLKLPQVDLQTSHVTHGGMCFRTILVPAGCALTGAITNADNVCVMHGDIVVTTDDGPRRLTGFHVLPARKGFKRAGIALALTWWATAWTTDLTDIAEIEREMTPEASMLQTRRPGIAFERPAALEG